MVDTYDTGTEAVADKAQQERLLAALDAWERALRRDECGAWAIHGARGSICTWGDGRTWVLRVGCRSPRAWTYAKRALSFCEVTQDGDDEGRLRLHALPDASQADVVRDVLGIRRRRHLSDEERKRLAAFGFKKKTP